MGNMNAKIGSDNTGYETVMRHDGLREMNENGERLANFCALNDFVIGGSIFQHKKIHKETWTSPDGLTRKQIDHFCISRRFWNSFEIVRSRRGADDVSDYHMLLGTLKLRLKKQANIQNIQRKNSE